MTISPMLAKRHRSKSNQYSIIIRVRHKGQDRQVPTGFSIEEKFWKQKEVSNKHPDAVIINSKIAELTSEIKTYFAQCQLQKRPINLQNIGSRPEAFSFTGYLLKRADQYKTKGMLIMATKTERLAKEIKDCFDQTIFFDDITQDLLRDYENYLVGNGNTENTRHKKYKFLQQFYSQAIEEGKAKLPNPFKLYKIITKPVKKEKLTPAEIKLIEDLQLKPGPINDARNLFLFSFYCKGMRFENCLLFKRDHISNGRLEFRSNKGNKYITVKIHARLQSLIDLYQGEFLFPFVKETPKTKREYISVVGSWNAIINKNLKVIAELAGINKVLTFHVARHTFAYQLKHLTGSIHVIKDSLGHSKTSTTEVYLKSLDDEVLDKEMEKLYGE
jgi:integrase/recombinase XerD